MTRRSARRAAALAFLSSLAVVPLARAFPGSVRWGYANCVTCHVNVAGGGVLTPYGRLLSRELLSTAGGEREPEFAYGAFGLPSWLQLGGDIAYAATADHPLHLMQADLEAAARHGRLLGVATVGRTGDTDHAMGRDWLSRRHYVEVAASRELSVRAGRFLPNFGVWNGDDTVATRAGLGWDRDTYNVEANWVADRWNVAATGILAGTGGPEVERGVSLSGGLFFAGKRKVWLSYVARGRPGLSRRAGGLATVLGLGSHAYLLAQGDLQRLETDGVARRDFYGNACLARETIKGLYVLLIDEVSRRDLGGPGRVSHSYGAALRFFPRPHFEAQLRWRQRDRDAVSTDLDGVSLFVHFYP